MASRRDHSTRRVTSVGEVVFSIDAELAWGYHDLDRAPDRVDNARQAWHTALRLLRKHDVPATWAIVGHLLLQECDGRHESHPLGPSWFPCEAGRVGPTTDDDWRAPNLVEAVRVADQDHEIASHSFSHVLLNDVDREVAAAEAAESVAAAERAGIDLESFVFPRNMVAHLDALAEHGFSCYRGTRPSRWYEDSRLRPLLKFVDWSPVGTEPPLVTPRLDEHGLVDVPASLYLFSFEGFGRRAASLVGRKPVVEVAKRGIDKAVDADGVFHMWLHPHNLLQPDGEERLDAILEYLSRRRAETDLTVQTMSEVARDVRAEHRG